MFLLDKWTWVDTLREGYLAPECATLSLTGIPSGRPDSRNGRRIITSEVVGLYVNDDGETVATTRSGSMYLLQNPIEGRSLHGLNSAFKRIHKARKGAGNPLKVDS